MFSSHVALHRLTAGIVGGISFGIKTGLLKDADLTSLATARTAVLNRAAVLGIGQRLWGARVIASLERADFFKPGYTSGGNAAAIYTIENDAPIRGLALRF